MDTLFNITNINKKHLERNHLKECQIYKKNFWNQKVLVHCSKAKGMNEVYQSKNNVSVKGPDIGRKSESLTTLVTFC